MKNIFKDNKLIFVLIVFILLLFVIAPSSVSALSYKSDLINLKEDTVLETNEFDISLEYTKFDNGTVDKPAAITGSAKKKVTNTYYYHYIVYYYNAHKQEIGVSDGYNEILDNMSSTDGSYFCSFLESKDMYNSYKIKDIQYYKVFIEPADKTIVENALYHNSQDNKIGIDKITDTNTINMGFGTTSDFNSTNSNVKDTTVDTTGNGEYAIKKYHIDMKVNENNTFDMNEQITAYFNIAKHGIFRSLPLKNTINRLDGTSSNNRAKITNVEVNNDYTTYKENGNYVIKIGSANSTLTGEQSYIVKYNYNIGKDPSKDYDELYFNLIGTEWDTTISDFTFTITLPKEFDSSNLGFSLGSLGSTDSTNINYTVNGNVITGSCNRVIKPGEALTVRMELPEGYFVGASNRGAGILTYLLFIIPIIFLGISFLMWKKYGKDDKVIETVEFYPPEGFNSLEIGYLYKGQAENQDAISLLIYLANKGYIKISEIDEKTLFSTKKGFKITKLKEYDGNNINEKIFLNGLFTKKPSFSNIISMMKNPSSVDTAKESSGSEVSEITSADLYNNFYITMGRILGNVNNKENKNKIFEKSTSGKTIFIILMIIATFCLITIPPILEFSEPRLIIFALLFPGIGFSIMFSMLFGGTKTIYVSGRATNSSVITKIFGVVFGGMFGGIPWVFMVLPTLLEEKIYLYGYIVGIICVMGMIMCVKYLPKRTPYGNQILGKILGFKNFLESAEKQKLEALVMKDPQYFYNILPYTYVLGVSDKWISKFETIALQAPNWYDSSTAFNVASFGTFMNSTIISASSAMSSNSSSSSGGGSSGGGSGGGGGGSW